MAAEGVVHRERHRPERRLMQDEIHARARLAAGGQVANIPFQESKPRPLRRAHQRLDLLQVLLLAGREIVQADHPLVQLQQSLQQVRADEPRDTRHQPCLGGGPEFCL